MGPHQISLSRKFSILYWPRLSEYETFYTNFLEYQGNQNSVILCMYFGGNHELYSNGFINTFQNSGRQYVSDYIQQYTIYYQKAQAITFQTFQIQLINFFNVISRENFRLYTVVQNKPDSTNQAIVSCCESYFKKNFLCNLRAICQEGFRNIICNLSLTTLS